MLSKRPRKFSLLIAFLACVGILSADAAEWDETARTIRVSAAEPSGHRLDGQVLQDLHCLALNIYWEARSESMNGQLAVAAVTMNRVRNERFPDTVCEVVKQGGWQRLHQCQFSWWCDGKHDEPKEVEAWRRAQFLARLVYAGVSGDPTKGALWYHADDVNPYWGAVTRATTKIGRHVFYDDLNGRNRYPGQS
jgi:N-acetylmuramoyl-L-alanine amidase